LEGLKGTLIKDRVLIGALKIIARILAVVLKLKMMIWKNLRRNVRK
jgi:hypothetical protein